jgi:hypothetical protein
MSSKYAVTFDEFSQRHYIKNFRKTYSERAWQLTENAIRFQCANIEALLKTTQCETISALSNARLCKYEFSVAGTHTSPKSSGNRCILVIDDEHYTVRILLVYHKSHIASDGNNETVAWKKKVRVQFPEYHPLMTL